MANIYSNSFLITFEQLPCSWQKHFTTGESDSKGSTAQEAGGQALPVFNDDAPTWNLLAAKLHVYCRRHQTLILTCAKAPAVERS